MRYHHLQHQTPWLACFWLWKLFTLAIYTTSLHWVGDVWIWVSTCCRDFLCYILRVYSTTQSDSANEPQIFYIRWFLLRTMAALSLPVLNWVHLPYLVACRVSLGTALSPFFVLSLHTVYCTCRISLYTCSRTENFRFTFWESLNTGLEKMLSNWRPCPPSPSPWPQQKQFFQNNWKIEYSSVGIFPLFLEQELTVQSFGFSRKKWSGWRSLWTGPSSKGLSTRLPSPASSPSRGRRPNGTSATRYIHYNRFQGPFCSQQELCPYLDSIISYSQQSLLQPFPVRLFLQPPYSS